MSDKRNMQSIWASAADFPKGPV